VAWVALGIVAVIKFNLDYLLVVGVALVLSIANIIGFTKCRKGISNILLLLQSYS
jgi:hypothetical protein